MGIDEDRPIEWEEAVGHWYDTVYLPVARAIADQGLLVRFPQRTEADLYLFLAEHRARLERELGYRLGGQQIAEGLVGPTAFESDKAAEDLLAAVGDGKMAPGSVSGFLREMLLLLDGGGGDDDVIAAGLTLAVDEAATVFGLWIGAPLPAGDRLAKSNAFEATCHAAGVNGQLAFAEGDSLKAVVARAIYVDLVMTQWQPTSRRHASWMRSLLNRIPKPLFLVKGSALRPQRLLLAFDGGVRSEMALFACAYLCLRNGATPVVLSVAELGRNAHSRLMSAREYLARLGVEAELVHETGSVVDAILTTASRQECDLILLGSYKYSRWLERVTGGVTERVAAKSPVPVLIT